MRMRRRYAGVCTPVTITLAVHDSIAFALTFPEGYMLALAERKVPFTLRDTWAVHHFAVSLALCRGWAGADARAGYDLPLSLAFAQSLPVTFTVPHYVGMVCILVFSLIAVPLGHGMGVELTLTEQGPWATLTMLCVVRWWVRVRMARRGAV